MGLEICRSVFVERRLEPNQICLCACVCFSLFWGVFVKARLIKMQGEPHTKDTPEGPKAGLLMQRVFFFFFYRICQFGRFWGIVWGEESKAH